MTRLDTTYMGLELSNPLIVASSGLTSTPAKILKCEQAGAGAIVIKSLFEEVLAAHDWGISDSTMHHPEAYDYLQAELQMQYGPEKYCEIISEAKEKVNIPVIASINCRSEKWWPEFAQKIENAGADALELNIYKIADNPDIKSGTIEKLYYDIVKAVKSKINIPVSLKISSSFTSLPNFCIRLQRGRLDGLVLFNRFTVPDIDIHSLKMFTTFAFSDKNEIFPSLRWIALLKNKIDIDLSASTGVHCAEGVIKLILAGASSVQLASILYESGLKKINEILAEVLEWMEKHNLKSVSEFQGKAAFADNADTELYLRTQFMEKIRGIE